MRADSFTSRALLGIGLGASMAVASACGAFSSSSDGADSAEPAGDAAAGTDVSTPDGAASGDAAVVPHDAAAEAEAAAVCMKTETFGDEADALIASSDTPFGTSPICNIHIGAGILRWNLSAAAAAALKSGTATALSMKLTRAATSTECIGFAGGCLNAAFTSVSGGLAASPLRSDWVEASVSWNYTSKPTTSWGSAGAKTLNQDRGEVAGTASVDAVMTSVTIPLDPAKVTPLWVAGTKVSFVVEAVNSGNLVFITREASATASNTTPTTPPPTLSVTYPCPDGG
jgi:hypothetical protein